MTNDKAKKTKGTIQAVAVAAFQGFEGLIFPILGLFFTFSIFTSFGFSAASLAVKEIFTLVLFCLIRGPKKMIRAFKRLKTDKDSILLVLAGIFGTTTGNLMYFIAIQMGGSSYGVILTSLYPIFSMMLIKFVTKEKEGWKVWLGALVALMGSLLFVLLPLVVGNNTVEPKQVIGIVVGAGAAFFWALEGVFINGYFRKKTKNDDVSTMDTVALRTTGSTVTTLVVVVPIAYFVSLGTNSHNPFVLIGQILAKWQTLLVMVILAVNLVMLRVIHMKAIFNIGAKLTAIIDTNNFLVPSLFAIGLQYTGYTYLGNSSELLFSPIVWWAWLLIIPILIGVYMVLYFHDEKRNEKVLEKVLD